MQTSKNKKYKTKNGVVVYLVLLLSSSFMIWFSQQSITYYWQQTYHSEPPISALEQNALWNKGKVWQAHSNEVYQVWKNSFKAYEDQWTLYWNPFAKMDALAEESKQEGVGAEPENVAQTVEQAETLNDIKPIENGEIQAVEKQQDFATPSVEKTELAQTTETQAANQGLTVNDQVLFVGDSLMQGVAPFIQKWLSTEFNIKSLDLSKQSTGLSYPSFFDWPATVEKELKRNPKIKLVIVFLGPNDPWDFPNPKGGKYLKFQTEEWEAVYSERINRILVAAENANAKVIWLGVPYMKKAKLNEQMIYLNQVLEKNLVNRVTYLPTDLLLSGNQKAYLDTINIDGKSTRVRSKDGIHFSGAGQKYIAQYVEKYIQISAKKIEKNTAVNADKNKGKK